MVRAECVARGITPEKALGIKLSTVPTKDLHYTVGNDTFDVIYHKNSPFNGKFYGKRLIKDAQCSVGDRTQKTHLVAGRTLRRNGQLLCVTGRPDSPRTAEELRNLLYKNLPQDKRPPKTFAVLNLMTPTPVSKYNFFNEKESTLNEDAALKTLKEKPFHFVIPTNIWSEGESLLPDWLSGYDVVKKINKETFARFKEQLKPSDKKLAEDCFYFLDKGHLKPEERIVLHVILCRLGGIPLVIHCKSSTDRTNVGTAIAAIVDSWKEPYPQKEGKIAPHLIVREADFKEQFYQHVMANLPTTKMARGKSGYTWGDKIWNINLAAARLMPERFTKPKAMRYFLLPLIGLLLVLGAAFDLVFGLFPYIKKPLLTSKAIEPYKAIPALEVDPTTGLLNNPPRGKDVAK